MASHAMTGTFPGLVPLYEYSYDNEETRWQAVQTRNNLADGFFVYAVRSTKIYCRPICKARLARRANVRFYDTPELARQDGFRACKRCKPDELGLMPEDMAVRKIRAFVAARAARGGEGRLSLGDMARRTGMSKWHFHRVFKRCVGVTPVEYASMCRQTDSPVSISSTTTPLSLSTDGLLNAPVIFEGPQGTPLAAPDVTCSESPATTDESDWLQHLDMATFDLDPILMDVGGGSGNLVGQTEQNRHSTHNDAAWVEWLTWPPRDNDKDVSKSAPSDTDCAS